MKLGTVYRWILHGFTPDTMPMARLAEYMQQLGKLLGNEAAVHFVRVEKGSLALVSTVDRGIAEGKVDARLSRLRAGNPQSDVARAFVSINEMLHADGATASLRRGSRTVANFSGARFVDREPLSIPDFGSIVGYLYMLSQGTKAYNARLRLDRDRTIQCTASEPVAKRLKDHLFETVRVSGYGLWKREREGWQASQLEISEVRRVVNAPLAEVVRELRTLDIAWPDDPLEYSSRLDEGGGTLQ